VSVGVPRSDDVTNACPDGRYDDASAFDTPTPIVRSAAADVIADVRDEDAVALPGMPET